MNLFKAVLDTRNHNGVVGKITQFDTATLEFQIVTDGQINEAWESPTFELIAMKRDEKPVRETEQDRFTILSKEEHKVRIDLKEQFLACRGSVKMQLIVKDGDRLSTSVFYIMVGESLDHGIVESHRDVAVLDELEQYVKTGYDALAYQEQRMKDVEKATHELNELMKENELQRQEAESERQSLFEENEIQRQGAFSQQLTSQRHAFDNSQSEREGAFDDLKRSMSSNFTVAQNEREYEFDNMMSSNQSRFDSAMSSNQTQFNSAESSRANTFSNSQIENERVFTANESARQTLFNTNEAARKTNETTRVANENTRKTNESSRVTAEAERQKKMSAFEAKATRLSNELDAQVERVDTFVSANEEKLLGDRDKVDYMGNVHESVKAASDANVDWLLGEVNTAHYEGQRITATDTIEGRAKSAILKGQTLVNVLDNSKINFNNNAKFEEDGFIKNFANGEYYVNSFMLKTPSIKPSTKYLLIYEVIENTIVGDSFRINADDSSYSTVFQNHNILVPAGTTGRFHTIVTSISDITNRANAIRSYMPSTNSGYIKYRCMLIEYQEGMENWDIPYFEGMQSVKMPVLTTVGKNLFDLNKVIELEGLVVKNDSIHIGNRVFPDELIYTFENAPTESILTFDISSADVANSGGALGSIWYEDGTYSWITINNRRYVNKKRVVGVKIHNWCEGTHIISNIQLEEGSATSYEPFKSNILTVNESVTLRSNGDVYDELNLLTGRLTQRIDENNEVLSQEVVKTVDLSDNVVYSYDEVTHYDCSSEEGSLVPTLSVDVPTNLSALVSRQRATIETQKEQIQTLEVENEQLIAQNEIQDEDIALNQDAINFMLFASEMSADENNKAKGVNTMAAYLANQILKGKLDYSLVVSRYPQFKEDIDTILILEGEENLIK